VAAGDRLLPGADLSVTELVLVWANPPETYAAISDADVSGDRLLSLLGGLTDLDRRFAGDRVPPRKLGELLGPALGFVQLADEPGALRAVGIAARYSPFDRGLEPLDREGFAAFDEAGHVKTVIDFSLRPQNGGRTLLSVDVRIRATDDETRSTLQATEFMVAPALRLLCRRLLELVKQQAEDGSGAERAEGRDGDRDQHDADRLPAG
jgi:hypothetical protein